MLVLQIKLFCNEDMEWLLIVNFFFCVFLYVCTQLPDDLNALWAYITFYGGECQLNLNKKVTHLVVKEPKGVSTLFPNLDVCRFSDAWPYFSLGDDKHVT